MYDAIVLGGGPAGLQAALTLGRMHRTALLLDSGEYRNGTVPHAHNLITHDGRNPAEIRRLALADIAAYDTVEVRSARATSVAPSGAGFAVTVDGEEVAGRNVVLATGLHDELPAIPGLAEHWGDRVANCPFCHGHEFAGRRVAILNATPHAAMVAAMLAPVVSEAIVLEPARVIGVASLTDGLRLSLADGGTEDVAGVFAAPVSRQRAPFAAQLGLAMQDSGAVRIDPMGRTSVPGVYAAGDMAHTDAYPGPLAALAAAISAGQAAAVGIVHALATEAVDAHA
jgi:thioredoxin reductase